MLVLGIETSCDETAASIVENGKKILSSVVLSSLRLHKPYAGVVPEIASRHHAELIDLVVKKAFSKAECSVKDTGLIAVTNRPGLIGALVVGLSCAKGLSVSSGLPIIGVNHTHAHLYASLMGSRFSFKFPFIGLVVSGGHTSLILVKDFDDYENIGNTTDDAVGEAYDKVAKILNLGYPGGPVIERLAKDGNSASIKFPKSLLKADNLDFSFSGIKTAVLYYVQKNASRLAKIPLTANRSPLTADICASFQDSVIDVIVEKSVKALRQNGIWTLVVGGGVSINSRLRERLKRDCGRININVYFPLSRLCLDNAAMVAGLGYQLYKKGHRGNLNLNAFAS